LCLFSILTFVMFSSIFVGIMADFEWWPLVKQFEEAGGFGQCKRSRAPFSPQALKSATEKFHFLFIFRIKMLALIF